MATISQVVLVGHCGADQFMLDRMVRHALGDDVTIASANDDRVLKTYVSSASLLLVNRELDGYFAAASGVELIRQLVHQTDPPAAMLISNYADAQQKAVDAGAQRGFGKSQLREADAIDQLKQAIGGSA